MQTNEITLTVDELNDGVTTADVDHVFTRFDEYQNRSVYNGSTHTFESRDQLGLYRTFPKPNANFKGVRKSTVKFTKDIVVTGVDGVSSITSPIITEISFSIPVGATDAQILIERQKALALLDLDAVMTPLNSLLEI